MCVEGILEDDVEYFWYVVVVDDYDDDGYQDEIGGYEWYYYFGEVGDVFDVIEDYYVQQQCYYDVDFQFQCLY